MIYSATLSSGLSLWKKQQPQVRLFFVILLVSINDLLSNLVFGIFIIKKQPPQVKLSLVILLVGINNPLSNLLTEEQPPQVRLAEGWANGHH
jgi:hypothetical protein